MFDLKIRIHERGLWDDVSSFASSAVDSVTNAVGGTSLSDIADTVQNANISDLTDALSGAVGNLTPAQVAAGITPKPAPVKAPAPVPVSTAVKVAGVSSLGLGALAVAAYFLLGKK